MVATLRAPLMRYTFSGPSRKERMLVERSMSLRQFVRVTTERWTRRRSGDAYDALDRNVFMSVMYRMVLETTGMRPGNSGTFFRFVVRKRDATTIKTPRETTAAGTSMLWEDKNELHARDGNSISSNIAILIAAEAALKVTVARQDAGQVPGLLRCSIPGSIVPRRYSL